MNTNPAAAINNTHHTVANRDDEDLDIRDVCKHGNYPGETSCGCTAPAEIERFTLARKYKAAGIKR